MMLHNVRSVHNVGSIFRTADAAGVAKIYLGGYTPTPRDRFGRTRKDMAKAALGAEKTISWESLASPRLLISRLKREGWRIVGVEQDTKAIEYSHFRPSGKTLFVFGNEVRGISRQLRDLCDLLIEIPMRGAVVRQAHHPRHVRRGKESLNVSVAAGIILYSCQPRRVAGRLSGSRPKRRDS